MDLPDETIYYLAFSAFPGIGPVRFSLIEKFFGSIRKAWEAKSKDLAEIGLNKALIEKFLKFRQCFSAEYFLHQLKSKNIEFISRASKFYPEVLRQIPDPPIGLFIKGEKERLVDKAPFIAVVGTRNMNDYGRQITEKLVSDLVGYGFTIVSGMAYGIDTVSHKTCLENGGKTIAVLGCGVDIIHPASNYKLYQDIITKRSLIVSEYPPGHLSSKGLFPARNRIVSGLSSSVLVIQGSEKSGSLITARLAVEQGRDVFAVPGSVFMENSKGPLMLIKQGAKLVSSVEDILEEMGSLSNLNHYKSTKNVAQIHLHGVEKDVLDILQNDEMHIDEIVKKTNIDIKKVISAITSLELYGLVTNTQDGKVTLRRKVHLRS